MSGSVMVAAHLGLPTKRVGRGGSKSPVHVRTFVKAFINEETGCWEWRGAKNELGYGVITIVKDGMRHTMRAHRISWSHIRGPIPQGLVLDHLCRNPSCINPDHLEPVPQALNVQRGRAGHHNKAKTHCVNGHEFTPENTKFLPGRDQRQCRACGAERLRIFYDKHGGRKCYERASRGQRSKPQSSVSCGRKGFLANK